MRQSEERVFSKLFEEAEIAKFTKTELREYEDSLKAYRDVKNSIDTALEQGRAEGERGMALQIARKMLSQGIDLKSVLEMTGLTEKDLKYILFVKILVVKK